MINPIVSVGRGWQQLRATRAAGGVPIHRQIRQLARMRAACGMSRTEYFKYRIWRDDLTPVERLTYTCQRERRLTEAETNGRPQVHRGWGKTGAAARFAAIGLAVPEFLGGIGAGPLATVRSAAELGVLLGRVGDGGVVIKPEHGWQGDDIIVAAHADGYEARLLSGATLPIADLWRRTGARSDKEWRIERLVPPHSAVAAWRPGATPTVRLLTLAVDGRIVVHAASAKVPKGDSGVDNLAKGNLAAPVDLLTGEVGVATDGAGQAWYARHPESGVAIQGVILPCWQEFLALATRAGELLLPRRAIGWDVAVSATGPVVLESNSSWCEKLVQLPAERGLTRGAFIRLLHEVGAGQLLAHRRWLSREWRAFEEAALEGVTL